LANLCIFWANLTPFSLQFAAGLAAAAAAGPLCALPVFVGVQVGLGRVAASDTEAPIILEIVV
jgi:hypothetical protein